MAKERIKQARLAEKFHRRTGVNWFKYSINRRYALCTNAVRRIIAQQIIAIGCFFQIETTKISIAH